MKKILFLFIILLGIFATVWITKSKTPSGRPDSYANGYSEVGAWYNRDAQEEDTGEITWQLDPEIPANYIPVPGADELYMVVDENGNIIKYRHRYQLEDGSWVWEDVNPDIPENYEPVEGLENVYKVTYEDGTVKYFRYIRNPDDTYAFIEVDEFGNPIGYDDPEGEEIPDNYEHIGSNVYAVKNSSGIPVMFKERSMDDFGNYEWTPVEVPDSLFTEMGSLEMPDIPEITAVNEYFTKETVQVPVFIQQQGQQQNPGRPNTVYQPYYAGTPIERIEQSDGSYTETETITETREEAGYTVTYVTKIISVYDVYGNLMSTRKEGPVEQSREMSGEGRAAADRSSISNSLSGEFARVSVGVTMDNSMAGEILAKMNTERAANGLGPLSLDTTGSAYQVAATRAAAMAAYDYADYNSPIYGTVGNMCSMYGIAAVTPQENTWKGNEGANADAVHQSLASNQGSYQAMMTDIHSCVGIAIAYKDGYVYVSEVFIN